MRWIVIATAVLCTCLTTPSWAAGGKQQAKAAPKTTAVDSMITSAFSLADRNKNGVLSQREFHQAQENLQVGIMQLAQAGQLNSVKKNGKQTTPPNGAAVFGMPLVDMNKSNQISQSDFSSYAHGIVQQAIAAKAASDAQARAARAQQARSRQNYRGRTSAQRSSQLSQPIIVVVPGGNSSAKKSKPASTNKQAQPAKAAAKKK